MTREDRRKKVLGIFEHLSRSGLTQCAFIQHPGAVNFTAEETELAPA
jgi:hypothetical protein